MTSQPDLKSIRNFRQVTEWLYRGAQPTQSGIKDLAQMGIKTVVCVRSGWRSISAEHKAVEAAGMRFIHIPLGYWSLPKEHKISEFLALLDDEDNHPVFVHCFHGADRTGFLVAMFRMCRQNWPVQQAYNEMKACGFHRFQLRHFKWFLWEQARRVEKRSEGNKENNLSVKQS